MTFSLKTTARIRTLGTEAATAHRTCWVPGIALCVTSIGSCNVHPLLISVTNEGAEAQGREVTAPGHLTAGGEARLSSPSPAQSYAGEVLNKSLHLPMDG